MALRCRPGDLAIVVKSNAGNEGKIVRCVKYVGGILWRGDNAPAPSWRVDRYLRDESGGHDNHVADSQLRPLRGDLTGDTESTDIPIRETT